MVAHTEMIARTKERHNSKAEYRGEGIRLDKALGLGALIAAASAALGAAAIERVPQAGIIGQQIFDLVSGGH